MQKLMTISGAFRKLVLVATAVILCYFAYGYIVNDIIYFNSNRFFFKLWETPSVSQTLLLALKLPLFCTFLLGVFWLQKLLNYYQQGQFFGQQAMQCYLWLIWLKLTDFVLDIVDTLTVGYYYRSVFDHAKIELAIDFNEITTILLMLVIAYLLKAAKEIEAENKEFV